MGDIPNVVAGCVSTSSANIPDSQDPTTPQPSLPEVASEEERRRLDNVRLRHQRLENFCSTRLPKNSIRLFHLDGTETDAHTERPIAGELVVVSLDDSPVFDTLSYVWACHSDKAKCEPGEGCCKPLEAPNDAYIIECTIQGNGSKRSENVPISKNGYIALQELRRQLGSVEIWIDSICINQSDRTEREDQVGLMGNIYSFARTTYIWIDDTLASSDPTSNTLTKSFDDLATSFQYLKYQHGVLEIFLLSHPRALKFWDRDGESQVLHKARIEALKSYRAPPTFEEKFRRTDLESLLRNPWFKRAWTFQEFILSHHPVMVSNQRLLDCDVFFKMMGKEWAVSLDPLHHDDYGTWKDLLSLWFRIDRPTDFNGKKIRKKTSNETSFAAYRDIIDGLNDSVFDSLWYLALYNLFCWGIPVSIISSLIVALAYHRASTAWWLVPILVPLFLFTFILLMPRPGHWRENSKRLSESLPEVVPINGAVSTVYLDLLSTLLKWNPDLVRLLIDAGKDQSSYPGPSWVPDWSSTGLRTWLDESYVYNTNEYSATQKVKLGVRIEESELCIPGFVTGSCRSITVIPFHMDLGLIAEERTEVYKDAALEVSTLRSLLQWLKVVKEESAVQPANEGLHQAVYEVLTGKIPVKQRRIYNIPGGVLSPPFPPERPDSQTRKFGEFYKWYGVMFAEAANVQSLQSLEALRERITKDPAMLSWHNEHIPAILGRRCLFVDSEGHLGSGPLSMEEGDQVALLAHFPVPAILRRCSDNAGYGQEGRHWFVGPAFIHGMMRGKAWDEDNFTEIRLV
ncbi:hypothetical protein O1611_g2925 [Lasiodiplodia mahajangana]|uniref:Uncharacterized protein n=1 Tax=Lasiodiplodia mahajangana TaxID=1108764 RepID=A0ACC2JT64_9PEZI|nr:hypothetical protein O1611_g2925 [Lasiodiplodia mahajangana]